MAVTSEGLVMRLQEGICEVREVRDGEAPYLIQLGWSVDVGGTPRRGFLVVAIVVHGGWGERSGNRVDLFLY